MGSLLVACVVGLFTLFGSAGLAGAQTPSQNQASPQAQPAAAPASRVFASDAGLVLNFIKPDKAADFEVVMAKLGEALQKSDKPERRQQAASWKVFRAVEPGANGSVLFVFVMDPAVKGADYTVSTILAEAFPDEVQDLYKRYADAYATGQNVVNLKLTAALGQTAPTSNAELIR
jgi:hypothetical protein